MFLTTFDKTILDVWAITSRCSGKEPALLWEECRPEIELRVKEHFVGGKFVPDNLMARTQFFLA